MQTQSFSLETASRPRITKRRVFIFLIILTVLIAGILITVTATRANLNRLILSDGKMKMDWWKHTPIYQIYPRSFQDSDGDGIGDLKGITKRVGYLHDLGIKAVWLSPIYQSPMADFGYDISDYTAIDKIFGTMEDFQELLDEIHKHGMYLIMDFVPNHTSDKHIWFNKSVHRESPYDEYYIWRDQPNNWLSFFGNSSWKYEPIRGQYYLHGFLIEQPDLNYRNDKLRQEMQNVLRFWIEKGVDGLRIDAIVMLVENEKFLDEPRSNQNVPPNNYYYLDHIYTKNQPETYQVVSEWTKFLLDFGESHNKHIFTCVEVGNGDQYSMKYYKAGVDFPFNFNMIEWNVSTTAPDLRQIIQNWMDIMPTGAWPNWVMGTHDCRRVANRLGGREYIDIANMLLLLLPGTPVCYYGDEIGMVDGEISFDQAVDPFGRNWGPDAYMNFSRDPERTPMQWENTANAGFTTGKPWLPISDTWRVNVEQETEDPNSHLSIFKMLVQLRKEPVFQNASNLKLIDVGDERVFVMSRELAETRYVIVFNLGHDGKTARIEKGLAIGKGKVVISSSNARNSRFNVDTDIDFDTPFEIENAQGYVIKLV